MRDFPAGQTEWLQDRLPAAVRTPPYLGLTFLAVNHAREALQDHRVRAALSLAVDSPHHHRTRAGQRRAAGYGPRQPLPVRVRYPLSENDRRVAIALQSMWRAIFVTAELERAETAIHYSALQQGDFDLGLASWLAVYDDAQTFTLLLQTESGPNNLGGYSNAEYDRLADAAARQAEPAARARLLREAEALAVREQALIPLYHHVARNLISPRVLGWQDNMLDVNRSRYLGLSAAGVR